MKMGLKFVGIGFELVGIVLASLYIGGMLDRTFSWNGMGVAGTILIGTAGWIAHMIFLLREIERPDKK
jgi:hypothetical protein